ncbi:MAG TPA: isoprenylcysteine carboxylmethyltransferase family protein [Acidimicrobiales bacterium]
MRDWLVRAVEVVFAAGWALFWAYWLIVAFSMKRGKVMLSRQLRIRIPLVIVVVVLVHLGAFRNHSLHTNGAREAIGLVLFALGLGFAIWARVHIGRNWGTPMSQKADPELVTSGPYHLVRHPIYSGILLGGIGTAVALSWLWLVVVAIGGAYFVYSAVNEEKFMSTTFPSTYPQYQRASKMFVPFVF